ncbi:MAG: histidine phosphatase family protein [Chlamydiae bacterium]|nr:histidine phosphatase family protein [Chlamydiota bacterium]
MKYLPFSHTLALFSLCTSLLSAKEVCFLLIRHGQTDWNKIGKIQGQQDIPLNEEGKLQAKALSEILVKEHPDISFIYSSDLSRALETAKTTADKLNVAVSILPSLREAKKGAAEGLTREEKKRLYGTLREELIKKFPQKKEAWKQTLIEGEESISTLVDRMKTSLLDIADKVPDKSKIAVFSHSTSIKSLIAEIKDQNLSDIMIKNCEITPIFYDSMDKKSPLKVLEEGKSP